MEKHMQATSKAKQGDQSRTETSWPAASLRLLYTKHFSGQGSTAAADCPCRVTASVQTSLALAGIAADECGNGISGLDLWWQLLLHYCGLGLAVEEALYRRAGHWR